ncbi:MAG: alanyl-tRNA editing protein [Clostridia bacterium]|nr:alanyl-tRNA editing protein [Clostridia bacterium]
MTKRLYEENSYIKEFEAIVISCEKDEDYYNVVLNQTAFFPEGGGQKSDVGCLDDSKVVEVIAKDDHIIHKTTKPFEAESIVKGKVDFEVRYKRMQNHTAEHMVSGIVHSLYGYTNVGFHMSENSMRVDFDGELKKEDIEKVELLANKAVWENLDVSVLFPSAQEAEKIDYRSKLEILFGLRLVKIGDLDCCACCAPHVNKTGEVGLIKIIDFTPYKKGTRIEMVAGIDAFYDYTKINNENKKLMGALSAPRNALFDAVNHLSETIALLTREKNILSKELALYKLNLIAINNNAYAFGEGFSHDDLRYASNKFVEEGRDICVLFSKMESGEYSYVVNSNNIDVTPMVKTMNEAFSGRGGGKGSYAQGKISADEKMIEDYIKNALKEWK